MGFLFDDDEDDEDEFLDMMDDFYIFDQMEKEEKERKRREERDLWGGEDDDDYFSTSPDYSETYTPQAKTKKGWTWGNTFFVIIVLIIIGTIRSNC